MVIPINKKVARREPGIGPARYKAAQRMLPVRPGQATARIPFGASGQPTLL
jgi:hypothetical protein